MIKGNFIENLPKVKNGSKSGRRDGYYNAWKPYITKEVYDIANENDIITSEEVIGENITGISVRIKDNLKESSLRFMRIRVLVE